MAAIRRHIDLPTPQPREPGPFALGEQDYVTDLLQSAGFCDISFDAWTGEQRVGGPGSDPESATRFVLDGMQVGDLVRASGDDTRAAVHRSLVELFERNCDNEGVRSEEHTSELQSLMRISYAVFCLKKKNNT